MTGTTRRATKQREAVESYLSDGATFVSAQQIYAGMREQGSTIGLATVYRALQGLVEDEGVDALRTDDGEVVYRRCRSGSHHHHLVCRECGRTVEVEGPAVEQWADAVAGQHGFRDISHTLELFGTCDHH
ncbi:Fur family transcriptional regulator [Angustibacter luteus]|uniref:Fur family transcriptional regulator n=1 Tax=Angustibacter luteus TaxID=658456 RepID=A0ABW1JKQ1_9ACTN